MPNKILSKVKTIVISAGHGLRDPGAVSGQYKEKDETEFIARKVVEKLKKENIKVEYLDRDAIVKNPTSGNDVLIQKINHINKTYSENDWVIEIHRDSAAGLGSDQANTQFGVYYFGGSPDSQAVAEEMVKTLKENGAFRSTWARPDTVARFGRLGWVRDTKPVAHILECGFMQGEHTEERLNWYATLATEAIYKAFTGNNYTNESQAAPVTPEKPVDSLPQYPREEVSIEARFLNFNDYPTIYQDAIRNNDLSWVVNSLIDRDVEISSFKLQVTDLRDKNSVKTQELAEKDSELADLRTQLNNSNQVNEDYQKIINGLNKDIIEKNKIIDKAQTDLSNQNVQNFSNTDKLGQTNVSKLEEFTGISQGEAVEFIKERLTKLTSTRLIGATIVAGAGLSNLQDPNAWIAIAGSVVAYILSEAAIKFKK